MLNMHKFRYLEKLLKNSTQHSYKFHSEDPNIGKHDVNAVNGCENKAKVHLLIQTCKKSLYYAKIRLGKERESIYKCKKKWVL